MRMFSTLPGELISIFKGLASSADAVGSRAYLIGAYPRSILLKEDCSELEVVITGDVQKTASHFVNSSKTIENKEIITEGRWTLIANPYSEGDFIKLTKSRLNMNGGGGDIQTESFCRGFSIDALAVSFNGINFGNVVDWVGAVSDIESRVLRMLTRELFNEHPIYILKALTYVTRYKLSFDPTTEALWKRAICEKTYKNISKEDAKKLGKEERKILKELMGA